MECMSPEETTRLVKMHAHYLYKKYQRQKILARPKFKNVRAILTHIPSSLLRMWLTVRLILSACLSFLRMVTENWHCPGCPKLHTMTAVDSSTCVSQHTSFDCCLRRLNVCMSTCLCIKKNTVLLSLPSGTWKLQYKNIYTVYFNIHLLYTYCFLFKH